jgi:NMD protein affecting ribosome stability and mRNA decay
MNQRAQGRKDRLIQEQVHDTYKMRNKLVEPTVCPGCGAIYRGGRWQWGEGPAGAQEATCPACHRIADKYPAGTVTLAGEFLQAHRDEILNLARNQEAKEKALHPLKRIIAIEEAGAELLITTTDPHLARGIGEAVNRAYNGELDFHYADESDILRVSWKR